MSTSASFTESIRCVLQDPAGGDDSFVLVSPLVFQQRPPITEISWAYKSVSTNDRTATAENVLDYGPYSRHPYSLMVFLDTVNEHTSLAACNLPAHILDGNSVILRRSPSGIYQSVDLTDAEKITLAHSHSEATEDWGEQGRTSYLAIEVPSQGPGPTTRNR